MRITNEELDKSKYVVLSYDHKNEDFKNELVIYDEEGICYWYDESILSGDTYDDAFDNALGNDNCKGVIFFISERFLLSQPCINEMKNFKNKYGLDNPSKFYIVVAPKGFMFSIDELYERLVLCAEKDPENKWLKDLSKRAKDITLNERIVQFWELCKDGKHMYGILNDKSKSGYIARSCAKGGRFQIAGVISEFTIKDIKESAFGVFPQNSDPEASHDMIYKSASRQLDSRSAYYAPVDWLILFEDEKTVTLLSKKILFSIEYLEVKYPIHRCNTTVSEIITGMFMKYFEMNENESYAKINAVRFLSRDELEALLKYCSNEKNTREILNPETSFFAQHTDNENSPVLWLAGDTENAYRVDSATKGFSKLRPGPETYGARIVIQVEKREENAE